MADNTHRPLLWSTLEEYEGDPEVLARMGGGDWNTKPAGFAEYLENLPEAEVSMRRRTFLKMSGFAAVLAMAAGCEKPAEKILPYVNAPEEVTLGIPNYYASTCGGCAAGCGVLVKTRESRPIKLEGNPKAAVNEGALCTRGQSALIELYDPDRLRNPVRVSDNSKAVWGDIDTEVADRLRAAGRRAVLVTGTLHGPARRAVLEKFRAQFPQMQHVVYDAFSDENRLRSREILFGSRVLPRYLYDKSKCTVLLGTDAMVESASPLEAQRRMGQQRRVLKTEDGKFTMGRLYAFEPVVTMSGMNADIRYRVLPTQMPAIALAIANQLNNDGHSVLRGVTLPSISISTVESGAGLESGTIKRVADDLWANRGESLVYTGGAMARTAEGLKLHLIVDVINAMLGNEGETIDSSRPSNQSQGSAADMLALLDEMRAGGVDVLLVGPNTNPAYSLPSSADVPGAFGEVGMKVSFSAHVDETAKLCDYVLPTAHYLEAWGDSEPYGGLLTLQQPTIGKLWDNRQFEESLMAIAVAAGSTDFQIEQPSAEEGAEPTMRPMTFHEFLRDTWQGIHAAGNYPARFEDFWFTALRNGSLTLQAPQGVAPSGPPNVRAAATEIAGVNPPSQASGYQLAVYPMPNLHDGTHANNPWLLELPDPVSKICWDNFVALAPAAARRERLRDGDIVRVTVNGQTVEGPVRRFPGMHENAIGVGTGWGRWAAGAVGNEEGFSAYELTQVANGVQTWSGAAAQIEKTGRKTELADVQGHNFMKRDPLDEGEPWRALVQATSLEMYNESEYAPQAVHHIPYWEHGEEKPDANNTKDFPYTRHKWRMTIDLNVCNGCNACMVACQAENNIPVVGKREVLVGREMHWIRIDRYYKGDPDNPEFVKSPMLCQHCDNAPCETVCPVLATVHSDEGINQQIYNRCVGTRYCANNCPYKVRRFNFYEYSRFRKGPHDELEEGAQKDLRKTPLVLALNPEITVRTKGIMEKCTFCQQRIRHAKYEAKKLGRNIPNGELKTACQQTCPTDAIVFGDALNADHLVNKIYKENKAKRGYGVLEEFNVRPNVLYLAHIWNRETKKDDVKYHRYKGHSDQDHGDDNGGTGHDSEEYQGQPAVQTTRTGAET